ncbi:MAG: DUF2384 domain-containing protein [Desulfomonile tiedjei]|nr:DUF2384 domain-containing protein [Desulfomonile tiedjei]
MSGTRGQTTSHDPKSAARKRAPSGTGRRASRRYLSLLGLDVKETAELLRQIRQGLPYRSLVHFMAATDLRKEDAITLVRISSRTLSRRKDQGRLMPEESDRLVRAAQIFAQALDLFEGDVESAREWLTISQPALGGSTPIEFAATEVGAREVEALIGRLEYGVPS